MSILSFLKGLPIDLGQGNLRITTKGKRIALEYVDPGQGKTALDIGCREGAQSEWLKAMGYEVTSIDVESNYPCAEIIDANKDLPFTDSSYDLIWCSEVLEHLERPTHFRAEIDRLLKPGGKLVLTTPNSAFWFYKVAALFGKTPQDLQNPTHIQFFNLQEIRALFPEAQLFGFFPYAIVRCKIARCIGALSPTFVVILKK